MNLLPTAVQEQRLHLSAHFLAGQGIEVGALHSPLWVSRRAHVRYVDRLSAEGLRRQYPELALCELTEVDVIDDGELLATFADGSLDFIIANHMLEHCENPLGTMRNHLAKLKDGGRLYYAVPDKRFSLDAERPLTDFQHLVRDDREGPAWSRRDHFIEFALLAEKAASAADAEVRAQRLMAMNYSIHFHVWDADRFRSIIEEAYEYLGRSFSTDWLEQNETEVIAVLRKSGPGKGTPPSKRLRPNSFNWRWKSFLRWWEFRFDPNAPLKGSATAHTGVLTSPMRFWIDQPNDVHTSQASRFRVAGWVVSASPGPVTVRARCGEQVFESVTTLERLDVVASMGGPAHVPNPVCGFNFEIDLTGKTGPVTIVFEFQDAISVLRSDPYTVDLQ